MNAHIVYIHMFRYVVYYNLQYLNYIIAIQSHFASNFNVTPVCSCIIIRY